MAADQPFNPFRPPEESAPALAPQPFPGPGPGSTVPPQPYGHPAYPHAHPSPWPAPSPAPPRDGPGTSALVLGVIAATLCWTFVLSVVTLIIGALAVIFGVIGVRRARRGAATNRAVALGGLWTGVGATVISAVLTVLFFVWVLRPVPVVSAAGADYLAGAGDEVVFDDGLVVVAEEPWENADGGWSVRMRFANEGDEDVELNGSRLTAAYDGEAVPGNGVVRERPASGALRPGETAMVGYRIEWPGERVDVLGIDFVPGDDYETAYWELDLPGGQASGDDGSGEDGGGSDGLDV
ncbi:DUF4190 domain-containing protein [Streptomyces sp. NBC_01803]|uniref:DUF4190 domain-containing protein n=1 Tax=Streptomyces sp. NBC_01803 TaxID=2975946 RepID=UPI002DD9D91F|nr:DUF4190 domain-containing protein [Streptomyces sp. NBC_01803]WSA43951.1 DUF4199 domain-containing protein [Streptomyces sp. NBC_01803]